jgi:hypothetical protein
VPLRRFRVPPSLHLKRFQLHPDGFEFPEAFAALRQLGLDVRQEVRDLGQATVVESFPDQEKTL